MAIMVVQLHCFGSLTNWSNYNTNQLSNFSIYDHLSLSTNIICQIAVPIFFAYQAICTPPYLTDINTVELITEKSC